MPRSRFDAEAAIVEVTRGNHVECRHRVDIVIADADGNLVRSFGDPRRPVFPRSSIKALQALPLIESGAADRFRLEPHQIALACASHNGEEMHVETATGMLAAAGLTEQCLECGAQLPDRLDDRNRLALSGEQPRAIHNNCSGKHSGFLCLAVEEGMDPQGYVRLGHRVQKTIAATLTEVTGATHGEDNHAIDGCSMPTYAIPLENLARAFARFGVGNDGGKVRSRAMIRLRDACMAHPEMVAGTGRFDTEIMSALKGRAFTKSGAEGVFVAALPEKGMGIALKVHDGAERASQVAIAACIESLLELDETEAKALKGLSNPVLLNRNDIEVGRVRPGFAA
ncbi:MAG: asparaginase [Nitratireductor sp.]|nr:asparaginase [Nitratireductor sp.]